jgi:hypothetical protein
MKPVSNVALHFNERLEPKPNSPATRAAMPPAPAAPAALSACSNALRSHIPHAPPSLIPTVNGNTVLSFSTHGHQSAAKGSLTTVSRSDIRVIQHLDSSALGLVRGTSLVLPRPLSTPMHHRQPSHPSGFPLRRHSLLYFSPRVSSHLSASLAALAARSPPPRTAAPPAARGSPTPTKLAVVTAPCPKEGAGACPKDGEALGGGRLAGPSAGGASCWPKEGDALGEEGGGNDEGGLCRVAVASATPADCQ